LSVRIGGVGKDNIVGTLPLIRVAKKLFDGLGPRSEFTTDLTDLDIPLQDLQGFSIRFHGGDMDRSPAYGFYSHGTRSGIEV
jgi:hypothetical protein